MGKRAIRLWIVILISFCFHHSASVSAQTQSNAKLTGGVQAKFKHVDKVLNQLIATFDNPLLWDKAVWNGRLKGTGKVTNYKFKDIVAEFRQYLTNGTLTINLRPDKPGLIRAAASTSKDIISLNYGAGSWEGKKLYSDYRLAITIFHEMMHNWQHYHWWSTGEYIPYTWDKETVAYEIEKYLPPTLFDTTQSEDPGGDTPLPTGQNLSKSYKWEAVFGKWKAGTGNIVEIFKDEDGIQCRILKPTAEQARERGQKPHDWVFTNAQPVTISGDQIQSNRAYAYARVSLCCPPLEPNATGRNKLTVLNDDSLRSDFLGPQYWSESQTKCGKCRWELKEDYLPNTSTWTRVKP